MQTTIRALNRFGLGAAIGERDEIGDPKQWLRRQIEAWDPPADAPSASAGLDVLGRLGDARRARDEDRLRALRRELRDLQLREANAALESRVLSDTPYVERLVAFWSNHLGVSVLAKVQVAAFAGDYEQAVIRRHVLGRYEDMVVASAKHPAMLFYLDNFQSVGPASPVGRMTARRGRPRGLNENYARELLELHTLGVAGGYQQQDVEELARLLTGWSVARQGPGARPDEPAGFVFRRAVHEPGSKRLLGRRYRTGLEEGERAILDLCRHPSTARHVATKLVGHFVSDDPPPSAVARIADVFERSHGDLRDVSAALIELPEAWSPEHRKFRTPQDWLVAILRAFRPSEGPGNLVPQLRQLRHAPWTAQSPRGFGDTTQDWSDSDALMHRAELASSVAGRVARRGRLDPARLLEVVELATGGPLEALLADESVSRAERIALALGGPAFQWR